MLTDHKVRFLTASDIKVIANRYRLLLLGDTPKARAASAILRLTKNGNKIGKTVVLDFKSTQKLGSPAVVSYKPLKLEVDKTVWTKAFISDDQQCNFIVAHELGHIALHNHDAQPFSGVKKAWIDFEEESAEWQANQFADFFLIRDRELHKYIAPSVVAQKCVTPLSCAERRFLERQSSRNVVVKTVLAQKYTGCDLIISVYPADIHLCKKIIA